MLQARAYLTYLCESLSFQAEFVSEEIFEKRRANEKLIEAINVNEFNWDLALKYNMQNCRSWLSYYDIAFKCKYE